MHVSLPNDYMLAESPDSYFFKNVFNTKLHVSIATDLPFRYAMGFIYNDSHYSVREFWPLKSISPL